MLSPCVESAMRAPSDTHTDTRTNTRTTYALFIIVKWRCQRTPITIIIFNEVHSRYSERTVHTVVYCICKVLSTWFSHVINLTILAKCSQCEYR